MAKNGRRRRDLPSGKRKAWTIFCILLIWAVAIALRVGIDVYFPLEHQELIKKYCEEFDLSKYGLDKYYIAAVICTESRFDENAESGKGAVGLMQILPDTGTWAAEKIGIEDYSAERLSEPEINIRIGCWYLAYLSDMFSGDIEKTLAAYNAGPGKVQEWIEGGELVNIEHVETVNYIMKVEQFYKIYKGIYHDF